MKKRHVVVLVLGDLGRSPRMQYHAYSLSRLNSAISDNNNNAPDINHRSSSDYHVSLVGYDGEDTISVLNNQPSVSIYRLPVWDLPSLRSIAVLHAVAKGLALFLSVLHRLWCLPRFQLIIIQNPPCLPALVAAIIVSWFSGCRIVLDWHNLGFAMFQERLGERHLLVRAAKLLECLLASFATHHICVSRAMKDWLAEHFNVRATVLYDRPPALFSRGAVSVRERHELLLRLNLTEASLFPVSPVLGDAECGAGVAGCVDGVSSIQTTTAQCAGDEVRLRTVQERVGLLMSCTSWTPDEDFTILLRALLVVEQQLQLLHQEQLHLEHQQGPLAIAAQGQHGFRRLAVVVTGKGPMKAAFEASVAAMTAQGLLGRYVAVRTAWLATGDYPALLRCADLGVSLHTSTSGLDLPMKVLDMFGSAVPVCAFRFPSLVELVQEGHNGLSFETSDELAQQLLRLLVRPNAAGPATATDTADSTLRELQHLKTGASEISSWEENWNSVMLPVVLAFSEK